MYLDKYLLTFIFISILIAIGIKIWADSFIHRIENSFSKSLEIQQSLIEEMQEKKVLVEIYVNGELNEKFYYVLRKDENFSNFLDGINYQKKLGIKYNSNEILEIRGVSKKEGFRWLAYLNDNQIKDSFNQTIISPGDKLILRYQSEL
jgi:hypothetical protein